MRVNGQLKIAQLEQLASASPTPTPTGRIYADVTSASAAIPRFYNGTSWKQMAFELSGDIVSQNSGTAVTVDWSTGLNQKVVLTGHCLISFSNPQAGKTHILVVQQTTVAQTSAQFMYKLNLIDQDSSGLPYQIPGVIAPNRTHSYGWLYKSGLRAANNAILGASKQPSSLMSTAALGASMHPLGNIIAIANATSPFMAHYPVWDEGLTTPGLGLQNIKTPTTGVGANSDAVYTPDGMFCIVASGTTPFVQAFHLDSGFCTGAAITAPTALAGAGKSCDVHPAGGFIAVGHTTTPFMTVLPILTNAWGTKLTDAVSLPAAQVNAIAFSPMGEYLAVGSGTSPFLEVYNFTQTQAAGAIGSKLTAPVSLPTGGPPASLGKGLAWRPQGDFIAMAMTVSPYLYVVPFNRATGAFGTPLTFGTGPSGQCNSVAWSPDGQYLFVSSTTSPFFFCYNFSASTIGTSVGTNIAAQANGIMVASSGEFLIVGLNATPFVNTHPAPTAAKNYLRII